MRILEGAVNEKEKTKLQERFGSKLSNIRKDKNITQEKLSFDISADRTYISYLERGKRNPSLYMLSKIAKALRVNLTDLLDF